MPGKGKPRSVWSGSITLAMISVPVTLSSATVDRDVSFNRHHAACGGRTGQQITCTACGLYDLKAGELAKGYEGTLITEDDLASLPVPSLHTVALTEFVPEAQVDPIYVEKTYLVSVEPKKGGEKPFALLHRALRRKQVAGVGKITMRSKETPCRVRATEDALLLEVLRWPDELRLEQAPLLPTVNVSEQESAMADGLIDMMTRSFDPTQFSDEYREQLLALIAAKQAGNAPVAVAVATPRADEPTDLMAQLAASMVAMKKAA